MTRLIFKAQLSFLNKVERCPSYQKIKTIANLHGHDRIATEKFAAFSCASDTWSSASLPQHMISWYMESIARVR